MMLEHESSEREKNTRYLYTNLYIMNSNDDDERCNDKKKIFNDWIECATSIDFWNIQYERMIWNEMKMCDVLVVCCVKQEN